MVLAESRFFEKPGKKRTLSKFWKIQTSHGVIFKSWQEFSHSLRLELKNLCRNFLPVFLLEEIEPITQNLKTGMIVHDLMILYLEPAEQ